MARPARRRSQPSADVCATVLDRECDRCARCGRMCTGTRGVDWSIHHRRLRGMGGDRRWDTHLPGNLIVLCGDGVSGCHGYVHLDSRADAEAHGWIIPRDTTDPTQAPLLYTHIDGERRWVYLDNHGGRHDQPPTPEEGP